MTTEAKNPPKPKRVYQLIPVNRYSGPLGANVERNASCPCGSGKKFKKCHGSRVLQQVPTMTPLPEIPDLPTAPDDTPLEPTKEARSPSPPYTKEFALESLSKLLNSNDLSIGMWGGLGRIGEGLPQGGCTSLTCPTFRLISTEEIRGIMKLLLE